MKTFGAILCLLGGLFWVTAAQAECAWQTQCDGDGNCQEVEVCGDALDMTESGHDAMMSVPTEIAAHDGGDTGDDLSLIDEGNCRVLDICGTETTVCD